MPSSRQGTGICREAQGEDCFWPCGRGAAPTPRLCACCAPPCPSGTVPHSTVTKTAGSRSENGREIMGLGFTCRAQVKTSSTSTEKISAPTNSSPGDEAPHQDTLRSCRQGITHNGPALGIYAPYRYLVQHPLHFVITFLQFSSGFLEWQGG